jgi:hypothetical protein
MDVVLYAVGALVAINAVIGVALVVRYKRERKKP